MQHRNVLSLLSLEKGKSNQVDLNLKKKKKVNHVGELR